MDQPLQDLSEMELARASQALYDAWFDARFIGLHDTAEKLKELRQPILNEIRRRQDLRRIG